MFAKRYRIMILCLLAASVMTAPSVAGPVTLNTGAFKMEFAADGKPSSFKIKTEDRELLDRSRPGDGFFITNVAEAEIPLTSLTFRNNRLTALSANGTQEVLFRVVQADRYLRFVIERLKGFPTDSGFILAFHMNVTPTVKVFATDYMTSESNGGNNVAVKWNYLWNRREEDPLGSFALYYAPDDDAEDDILLRLWANEGLPHPKIQGVWTYQRAKDWVARWHDMFQDQSQFILEADNLQDLYKGVPYAEAAGVKQIYLFTNTWRGGFWPTDQGHWQLREDVFPNGEEDLRAFSDYLLKKGIWLKLHYLSGSLGFRDPIYLSEKPDRRLASWGGGRLARPIDTDDNTLYFKPDPGVELPGNVDRGNFYLKPPLLRRVHGFSYMRIDNEIIQAGDFEDTHKQIWRIVNCKRGLFRTRAANHSAGTDMAGLVDTYGQNFLPGNDTTLLAEVARGYAEFCNRCGIYNVEFDGFENNSYEGRWGSEKYASLIYRSLDHPTTSGGSSGRPPDCWMEYKLNSTQRLMEGFRFHVHSSYRAPLILNSPSRPATKLLDAHFELCQGAAVGAPGMGLSKPQPMFGLTVDELETYGLTDQMTHIVRNWKTASQYMTNKQRQKIKESFLPPDMHLPGSSRERRSPFVYRLNRKNETTFEIRPVKVMTRKTGDIMWHSWQEHGPIEPKQFVKPDDQLKLENPFRPQPPEFIIRVLWATDYNAAENLELLPDNVNITNTGDAEIKQQQDTLAIKFQNHRASDQWNLETLPQWTRKPFDMTRHRSLGMSITGDGSHSILLFNIPGCDYVVPIDFTGTRYVEIPHGQAAWADGRWGWRVATHRGSYDRVGRFSLGLAYVPKKTTSTVKVQSPKALNEIDSPLVNPVIHIDDGSLKIVGSIAAGHYLQYQGGHEAIVFDENWNRFKRLPVQIRNYIMPQGWGNISVTADIDKSRPWLEVQFMTRGEPMTVNMD